MIKLQSISKSFDGVSVFENISAEIPDSGIFAICGASGSGKTTLMRIILGLEQPDSGNIYGLEGKKSAVVFQNDRLLPWFSALDNVAAVCSKERAKELLEKVELSDSLDKKPAELSGGMCRRVALARALAFDADILLLDEPFKGLDDLTREKVMQFVKETRQHRTLILVTHDPRDAKDLNAAQILNIEPV